MAKDKDHYGYDPFYYNHDELNQTSFPFLRDNSHSTPTQNLQGFDPSITSFTDCLHGSMDYNTLSRAFDLSCSSSEVISSIDDNPKKPSTGDSVGIIRRNPGTPNSSSVSSSSTEAEVITQEDSSAKSKKDKQPKGDDEDADEKSKKE
ncbi:hypothetical protein L6164_031206 [Bauhinia variegata]|nr:hypothetical protein L6164_031206 [Bauhinia variegata]